MTRDEVLNKLREIPWDQLQDWAQFVAVDKNGVVYAYDARPERSRFFEAWKLSSLCGHDAHRIPVEPTDTAIENWQDLCFTIDEIYPPETEELPQDFWLEVTPEQSRHVQECLLSTGITWVSRDNCVQYTEAPVIGRQARYRDRANGPCIFKRVDIRDAPETGKITFEQFCNVFGWPESGEIAQESDKQDTSCDAVLRENAKTLLPVSAWKLRITAESWPLLCQAVLKREYDKDRDHPAWLYRDGNTFSTPDIFWTIPEFVVEITLEQFIQVYGHEIEAEIKQMLSAAAKPGPDPEPVEGPWFDRAIAQANINKMMPDRRPNRHYACDQCCFETSYRGSMVAHYKEAHDGRLGSVLIGVDGKSLERTGE